jgi:hypothetical protein
VNGSATIRMSNEAATRETTMRRLLQTMCRTRSG